ncbi:hypothetical protein EB796_003808 [Bugula neritina]|uniref:Uncharacterized protein n=1 Tax=Bugula neritina TaxID=10212 RepID=A0A7J7KHZ1_BUGNE|nr:hypothetical protein EB796_003808 [Bugula neritina]
MFQYNKRNLITEIINFRVPNICCRICSPPSSYGTAFTFKCLQILRTTLNSYCKHVRHTQGTSSWGRLLMPCHIQINECSDIPVNLHLTIAYPAFGR